MQYTFALILAVAVVFFSACSFGTEVEGKWVNPDDPDDYYELKPDKTWYAQTGPRSGAQGTYSVTGDEITFALPMGIAMKAKVSGSTMLVLADNKEYIKLSSLSGPVAQKARARKRLAEAKALAGSALTALAGCVQVKGSGSTCEVTEVQDRIGLAATNGTNDGRWVVNTAQLSVTTDVPPILYGTITVSGVSGKNTDSMSLALFVNANGVTARCNTGTTTPPASSTLGESC